MLAGRFEVLDMSALPGVEPPEETEETFEENAALKALHAASHFDGLVLADDSGLEVDALGGAPGVYSARYAGENATDAENREKLMANLSEASDRTARFRCVLAVARADRILLTCGGEVTGLIAKQASGTGGFGYDPIFLPEGLDQTMAELSAADKNALSHRGRAISAFLQSMPALIGAS